MSFGLFGHQFGICGGSNTTGGCVVVVVADTNKLTDYRACSVTNVRQEIKGVFITLNVF